MEDSRGSLLERIPAGLRRRVLPAEPPALARAHYEASLWAVLVLGVSLGLQGIATLMVAVGPLAEPPPAETLTLVGQLNLTPSHDLGAYAAGCVATVVLIALLVRAWSWRLCRADLADPIRAAVLGAGLHAGLAVLSLGAWFLALDFLRDSFAEALILPRWGLALLAAPTCVALVAIGLYHAHWLSKPYGGMAA